MRIETTETNSIAQETPPNSIVLGTSADGFRVLNRYAANKPTNEPTTTPSIIRVTDSPISILLIWELEEPLAMMHANSRSRSPTETKISKLTPKNMMATDRAYSM